MATDSGKRMTWDDLDAEDKKFLTAYREAAPERQKAMVVMMEMMGILQDDPGVAPFFRQVLEISEDHAGKQSVVLYMDMGDPPLKSVLDIPDKAVETVRASLAFATDGAAYTKDASPADDEDAAKD